MPVAANPPSSSRTMCCAWCRRVRLPGGWVDRSVHPAPEPDEANYGICPRCAARVRATYLSQSG